MTCATATINEYDIGDAVELLGVFTLGSSSEEYDPTVVRVRVLDPLGVITVFVYGTDVELEQDSAGSYSIIIRPTVPGLFTYRWEAEDVGDNARYGADERRFVVEQSVFYDGLGVPSVSSGGSAGFDGGSP